MSIELLDHYPAELDDLAGAASDASFYQTSGWIAAIGAAFPHMRPRCLVARNAGAVTGYLPFFSVRRGPMQFLHSMPFGTYGGPVVDGDEAAAGSLLDAYLNQGRRIGVLEVSWTDFWNRPVAGPETVERHSTQVIDLTGGFESIWRDDFEKAKRRQARKAEREGLAVVDAGTDRDIDAFYAIYRDRIDEWGESFRYPRRFLGALLAAGGPRVKLYLVKQDGDVLGGHLNFYFKDMVTAWSGVTSSDSRSSQASTYLYSYLIKRACESGFTRYNLGSSLGKRTLEEYKAALGGKSYEYCRHRLTSRAGKLVRRCRTFLSRNR